MHILFTIPKLKIGGAERHTIDLALWLKNNGHDPIIVSGSGNMQKILRKSGIKVIRVPVYLHGWTIRIINAFCILAIIKFYNVKVVHCMSRTTSLSSLIAAKLANIPMISTFHGAYKKKKSKIFRFKNDAIMKSNRIIAPSQFIIEHISKYWPGSINKIQLIHNWSNPQIFLENIITKDKEFKILSKLNLNSSHKIISLVCRLNVNKGVFIFIDAFAYINDPLVVGIIAGAGNRKIRNSILKHIKSLGLENKVFLLEGEDIAALYKVSYISVVPSIRPESFGLSVVEAGSLGVPVVGFSHGGIQELIVHKENGLLLNDFSAKSLYYGVSKMVNLSHNDYMRMSYFAKKNVQDNFNQDKLANSILDVYNHEIELKTNMTKSHL